MAGISMDQVKQFVQRYYPIAQQMEQKYGMPAFALLSQAAHETNFGTSDLFYKNNNMGGIGASDSNPHPMSFASPDDSLDYMARVQMGKAQQPENQAFTKQRYGPTATILADKNSSPAAVFDAMQKSKWASDPKYASNLMTRYTQIQPYLQGTPPASGQVLGTSQPIQTITHNIQDPHPGQTRIYSGRNIANQPSYSPNQVTQNDQIYANNMNQQMASAPANQPGYIQPQSPTQTIDIDQIGKTLGGWWNNLMGK